MKLVIDTQCKENYAAHTEDYVHGMDDSYWKFKGGNTYVIENLRGIYGTTEFNALVDEVRELIEYSNDSSEEYILDWRIADDSDSVCESWETPHILYKQGTEWLATRVTDNRGDNGYMRQEVLEKRECWVMLPNDRKNYMSSFVMNDNQVIQFDGFADWNKQQVQVA